MTISSTPSRVRSAAICRRGRRGRSMGSAICKRRSPLRTAQRNARRMHVLVGRAPRDEPHPGRDASTAACPASPRGRAGGAPTGSSWWKRTDTAMCVLDVKSQAWKPTRSMRRRDREHVRRRQPGGSPEALVAVARRRVDDLDHPGAHRARRRGRAAAPDSTSSAFSAQTSTIVPAMPAWTAFIIFMTSIRQTTVSALDLGADLDERCRARRLGAVEGAEHRRVDRGRDAASAAGLSPDPVAVGCARCSARPAVRPPRRRGAEIRPSRSRSSSSSRLVDEPQDLADVVVRQGHRRSGSLAARGCAPKVLMTMRQRRGARGCGRLRAPPSPAGTGGRAGLRRLAPAGNRPLDVLMAAEVALDASSTSTSSIGAAPRPGTARPGAPRAPRLARSRGPPPSGQVLDVLGADALAHDLAGDLADQVVVGRHLSAHHGRARGPSSR